MPQENFLFVFPFRFCSIFCFHNGIGIKWSKDILMVKGSKSVFQIEPWYRKTIPVFDTENPKVISVSIVDQLLILIILILFLYFNYRELLFICISVTFIEVMAVAYTMEDHSQRLCQNILREMKKIKIGNNEEYFYIFL